MAFNTVNNRRGAQGTFLLPVHPVADGAALSQADRQQVQGVYPGILVGEPAPPTGWTVGSRGRLTIRGRERYDYGKAGWYPDAIIN